MLILKKKNYLEAQPSEVCKEKRKKTKESQRKCQHFLWTCVLGSFPILTKVKGGKSWENVQIPKIMLKNA